MNMWNREFWKDLAERAISTFVQTFAGLLLVALPVEGSDLLADGQAVLGAVGVAAVTAGLAAVKAVLKRLKAVTSKKAKKADEDDYQPRHAA